MKIFLVELFKVINEAGINYCVLRNYEMLPGSAGNSDIDIWVAPEHLEKFRLLVSKQIRKYDGTVIAAYNLSDFSSICFVWKEFKLLFGLQLDIYTDETYRGIPYFDGKLIFSRSCMHNEIVRVAKKTDGMLLALLKEALSNGMSRKNYLSEAREAYKSDRLFYRKVFGKYFGSECAEVWDEFLVQADSSYSLREVSRLARLNLLKEACRKNLKKTFYKKIKYSLWRGKRFFFPPGFTIAFIGTDGSGKSTIIEGIRPPLEAALHSPLKYEHMRPNLLPSLARLLGRGEPEPGKPVADPHASSTSGLVGSFLRLCYYSLDFILGYWFKVYPDKVRKPCLYVFDRYFYDYIIDPVRSRIDLPKKLLEWWRLIIPEPDLLLCLGAEPGIIHVRKPELPLDEVKRQVDELRSFCRKHPGRAVWIDTGLPVEESIAQALQAIVDRMAARYE